MRLKSIKFINQLSEEALKECSDLMDKYFEKKIEEFYFRKDVSLKYMLYYAVTTILQLALLAGNIITGKEWIGIVSILYGPFYMVTNIWFTRIYYRLKYHKKMPVVRKKDTNFFYDQYNKLKSAEIIKYMELLRKEKVDAEITYTLSTDGLCVYRVFNGKFACLINTMKVDKVKYDNTITEPIYDLSDLSLTVFSEEDPIPKSFRAEE